MQAVLMEIELQKIHPSKLNPRLEINIERINELADSIREVGLLEPIIVRPVNGEFEVVVGERRLRASLQAGLEKIPAIVREYSDDEVVQLNLVENVHREELSAVEKGKVCKYLLEQCHEKYPSQKVLAKKVGVSSDTISSWLRTVEVVPEEAQKYVAPSMVSGEVPEGKVDYQTAVKVSRQIKEPDRQVELISKLAEKHLPVKERKQVIEKLASKPEMPIDEAFEIVAEEPCTLQFAAADKEPVLNGKKTQMLMAEMPPARVKAGEVVHAFVWEPRFADLRVVSVERKKLKYFNDEDAGREGGYTLEELKTRWRESHGEWDENQLVYIIRFEKIA